MLKNPWIQTSKQVKWKLIIMPQIICIVDFILLWDINYQKNVNCKQYFFLFFTMVNYIFISFIFFSIRNYRRSRPLKEFPLKIISKIYYYPSLVKFNVWKVLQVIKFNIFIVALKNFLNSFHWKFELLLQIFFSCLFLY